jgi:polyhydroxyalkanoate synthesis regulator phasin
MAQTLALLRAMKEMMPRLEAKMDTNLKEIKEDMRARQKEMTACQEATEAYPEKIGRCQNWRDDL